MRHSSKRKWIKIYWCIFLPFWPCIMFFLYSILLQTIHYMLFLTFVRSLHCSDLFDRWGRNLCCDYKQWRNRMRVHYYNLYDRDPQYTCTITQNNKASFNKWLERDTFSFKLQKHKNITLNRKWAVSKPWQKYPLKFCTVY